MLEEPNFRGLMGCKDDSGDDELAVLPRDTKVIVTGNNRTKSDLVGLQGVVKKAVGLGGWHWLELKNGMEVKLQRNALSVIEQPAGNEQTDTVTNNTDQCEFESSSSSDIAAVAVASPPPKGHLPSSGSEFRKPRKPKVRHARSWVAPLDHESAGNLVSTQTNGVLAKKKESNNGVDAPSGNNNSKSSLDFSKLGTDSLARYCQHYKLFPTSSNHAVSREEMIIWVTHHFRSQTVSNEHKVVKATVRATKKPRQEDKEMAHIDQED